MKFLPPSQRLEKHKHIANNVGADDPVRPKNEIEIIVGVDAHIDPKLKNMEDR
jgi:hypothetical protein